MYSFLVVYKTPVPNINTVKELIKLVLFYLKVKFFIFNGNILIFVTDQSVRNTPFVTESDTERNS